MQLKHKVQMPHFRNLLPSLGMNQFRQDCIPQTINPELAACPLKKCFPRHSRRRCILRCTINLQDCLLLWTTVSFSLLLDVGVVRARLLVGFGWQTAAAAASSGRGPSYLSPEEAFALYCQESSKIRRRRRRRSRSKNKTLCFETHTTDRLSRACAAIKATISYIAANDYLLFLISFPSVGSFVGSYRSGLFGTTASAIAVDIQSFWHVCDS